MCRVCQTETGSESDLCGDHDGKRPSSVIVYTWEPRNADTAAELRGARCVIEATGGDEAIVRFLDTKQKQPRRLTVLRQSLRRAA
jgi:hypothetical protein